MKEKILKGRKIGMLVAILTIIVEIALFAVFLFCVFTFGDESAIPAIPIFLFCIGWIPFLGLKVLKPQEALVLTLFGKYIGTLKGEGFYFVNPFCVAVNPAAKTKLSQSGDVNTLSAMPQANGQSAAAVAEKKLSLKIMTLFLLFRESYPKSRMPRAQSYPDNHQEFSG